MRALIGKVILGAAIATITVTGMFAQAQPQWKDRAEYDLSVAIGKAIQDNDGAKALELVKQWKEKYPTSDFKATWPQYELNAYRLMNDPKGMMSAAEGIIAATPDDLTANYWVCTLTIGNNLTGEGDLARAERSGNTLANITKPATVPDAQWPPIQKEMTSLGHKCLGVVALNRKDYSKAESEFVASLKIKPEDAQVNSLLGNAILAQKDPEKQSDALFHYARAASYTGTGALPEATRSQLDAFLVKAYNSYHGDDPQGLAELRTIAKNNALPPAGFEVLSEAEKAAAADKKMQEENPQRFFWVRLKSALTAPNGMEYFEGGMKDALVPSKEQAPLKGTVISSTKKSFVLALSDDTTPEVTVTLGQPMKQELAPGTVVEFRGVPQKLTLSPFMLDFLIDGEVASYHVVQ
ncbi:MAG: hypothetical protein LC114_20525 [Bryobacterales bacterium]|nr:hypothetical protein [Bryobacterales bacterium]